MTRLPVRVGIESLLVGLAALVFAIIANAVSPRGLALSEPKEGSAVLESADDLVRYKGEHPSALLIDAQGSFGYAAGHIPGALCLDLGKVETTLAPILQAAAGADGAIVYCKSSDCANSLAAANLLQQAHVPAHGRIMLYRGGIRDWVERHHPIAEGRRP